MGVVTLNARVSGGTRGWVTRVSGTGGATIG